MSQAELPAKPWSYDHVSHHSTCERVTAVLNYKGFRLGGLNAFLCPTLWEFLRIPRLSFPCPRLILLLKHLAWSSPSLLSADQNRLQALVANLKTLSGDDLFALCPRKMVAALQLKTNSHST